MTHRIDWDKPYNQDEMPIRRNWLWVGLLGAACWLVIFSMGMVIFALTACGPSQQRIDTMNPTELWFAHNREVAVWDKPNMDIIRALHARGGLDDSDLEYYRTAGRADPRPHYQCWGQTHPIDWCGMGYTYDQWHDEWVLHIDTKVNSYTGVGETTVYTSSGSVTVRRMGGGTISVRTSR